MATEAKLLEKLEEIKEELHYIREHMVDVDMVLTPKEEKRLNAALSEYKRGKAVSLNQFEHKQRR